MSTALEGDLRQFFPAEILQLLSLSEATGRLDLERPGEHAEVFMDRGRPVFARTDRGSVRTGELLVHRGQLAAPLLSAALAAQPHHPGRPIGALLVESGVAEVPHVEQAVREVLRRIVYGVLLWRDGRFRFVPGARPAHLDIEIDIDLDRLILEGLRLADQARQHPPRADAN